MTRYRLVYMSSSEFGIPAFNALMRQPWCEMVALITQPDRPAGRGMRVSPLPIKEVAQAQGVHVLQPSDLRTTEAILQVHSLAPDVIVVAAYGQWIPTEIYDMPPRRSLNIHPSLLPRHRGAAPAMSAILAGDDETGVSILFVVDEMDAGDLLGQTRIPIQPEDTTASLMEKLSALGADLIVDVLCKWLAGGIQPVPQDHSQATWFGRIKKEKGRIDWSQPAEHIWRQVRAFNPWPSAFTFHLGKRLVIHQARPVTGEQPDLLPGDVVLTPQGPAVATGNGLLLLQEVQLEGKRSIAGNDFVVGQRQFIGGRLG